MHTILVVDDNATMLKSLTRLLTAMGNESLGVLSGTQALESLNTHIPKLLILDVMMPGMDGMEVLRRVRSNPKTAHLPVVMFSGLDDPEYSAYAKREGAADFWVKSKVDLSNLNQLVAPYLQPPAPHPAACD